MTDERLVTTAPVVASPKERAQLVAKALSEAARRARFSVKRRRGAASGGLRARRGDKILRIIRRVTFVGIVLVPSVSAAIYYAFVASNQYVAEARFTVLGGLPPGPDTIGSLTGLPGALIVQDTQVVMNFVQSRAMVEALEKDASFSDVYGSKNVDFVARLPSDATIEKRVRYWKSMYDLSIQMPAGIVVLAVRAFSPEDSVRVTDAALEASEVLINKLNDQMGSDALILAEKERVRAEANLAKARAKLEQVRNEEGILSAESAETGLSGLITAVQTQLIKMKQDYDSQRRYVNENAPQLRNLQTKINAANAEIASLQSRLTQTGPSDPLGSGKVLSGSISKLDLAKLENMIAERTYSAALTALEHARLATETKQMYLNAFIRPVAAQEARYPKRLLMFGLILGGSLAVWGTIIGFAHLIRNNKA